MNTFALPRSANVSPTLSKYDTLSMVMPVVLGVMKFCVSRYAAPSTSRCSLLSLDIL